MIDMDTSTEFCLLGHLLVRPPADQADVPAPAGEVNPRSFPMLGYPPAIARQ
jgi:hypothetical protein